MPTNKETVSDKQLSQSTPNVELSSKRNRPTVDTVVKLVQVLALIAAGIWTIYTYVTYQRGQQQLSIQQQQIQKDQGALTLEQSRLLAKTRSDSEKTTLELQRFDFAQKSLLAETQKKTAEISLRQQEFTLAQNQLMAGTQKDIAQTNLEQQRLTLAQRRLMSEDEVRKSSAEATIKTNEAELSQQHALQNTTTGTLTKLGVDSSGVTEYKLILSVTVHNVSNKAFDIPAASVEVFTGELTKDWGGDRVIRINSPLDYYKGRGTRTPIKWESAIQMVYVSPNADVGDKTVTKLVPCIEDLNKLDLKTADSGVFAFGLLGKGMNLTNDLELRIKSRSTGWISFRVDLFFCSGRDNKKGSYSRKDGFFELSQIQ